MQADHPNQRQHDHPLADPVIARIVLAILCIIAFLPFLWADLFWDDYLVIRPDGPIADLGTLRIAFFGRCVLFDPTYVYPYYRPLIDSLFILEYAIAGTHPLLYHATNFVLHTSSVLMTYGLLRRVLNTNAADGRANLATLLGVGVFALHPLQVESVLWPAARPAVLGLFFALLGLHAMVRLAEPRQGIGRQVLLVIASVAGFTGSLLSKEIAVVFVPALLLLLAARPHRPRLPMVVAFTAISFVLVVYMYMNRAIGESAGNLRSAGLSGFFLLLFRAYGFYLSKLALPLGLIPRYPVGVENHVAYLVTGIVGAILSLAAMVACLYTRRWAWVVAGAGIAFWGGSSLLPLFGGQTTLADRYLYQALWGLGMAVGAILVQLTRPSNSLLLARATTAALLLLALLALGQSLAWQSSEGMWSKIVRIDPESYEANMFLGEYHERRGEFPAALQRYTTILDAERRASDANLAESALAAGRVLFSMNEGDRAIEAYRLAAQYPPLATEAAVREAVVLFATDRIDASRAILASLNIGPGERATVYTNLALLEWRMNRDAPAALRWYDQARQRGAGINPELESLRSTDGSAGQ